MTTLIVARSVRTGENKFFIANGVVGEKGVALRGLLRVAFGRWAIEAEFRISNEELGMDHFEVRDWRCIHRHDYLTGLSFLLCSRIRQSLDKNDTGQLTVEQVRRSSTVNCPKKNSSGNSTSRSTISDATHGRSSHTQNHASGSMRVLASTFTKSNPAYHPF